MNKKFKVGRYHSLKLKEPFYSKNFEITMRCSISNSAMAIENNQEKIYGFQFHPESFLTENGNLLIKKAGDSDCMTFLRYSHGQPPGTINAHTTHELSMAP